MHVDSESKKAYSRHCAALRQSFYLLYIFQDQFLVMYLLEARKNLVIYLVDKMIGLGLSDDPSALFSNSDSIK